jgi:hypothetical protein
LIYNSKELFKLIKTESENRKGVDQHVENLLIVHKNFDEYYTRFKSKYTEYKNEFMTLAMDANKK